MAKCTPPRHALPRSLWVGASVLPCCQGCLTTGTLKPQLRATNPRARPDACRYMVFAVATAAELAACLIAGCLLDRLGRHLTICLGFVVGGIACLATPWVSSAALQATLAAAGKFGCSGGWRARGTHFYWLLASGRCRVHSHCMPASGRPAGWALCCMHAVRALQ